MQVTPERAFPDLDAARWKRFIRWLRETVRPADVRRVA
jgi:hypothetical protein